jgi:hypothetical protein
LRARTQRRVRNATRSSMYRSGLDKNGERSTPPAAHAPPTVEDRKAARGKPARAISASPARSRSAGLS